MTSSRFDPGLTSKILNLSLLWFNERFGSKNLDNETQKKYLSKIYDSLLNGPYHGQININKKKKKISILKIFYKELHGDSFGK